MAIWQSQSARSITLILVVSELLCLPIFYEAKLSVIIAVTHFKLSSVVATISSVPMDRHMFLNKASSSCACCLSHCCGNSADVN